MEIVSRKLHVRFSGPYMSLDGYRYYRDIDTVRFFKAEAGMDVEIHKETGKGQPYILVRSYEMKGTGRWETWKREEKRTK